MGDQFVIGFGVVSDWFREWHEFFCTNHKASQSKSKVISDFFRTSWKIVLIASSTAVIFICHLSFLFFCFTKDPPTITFYQRAFTVNETNDVTMTCRAKGVPQPTITWRKIEDELNCLGEHCIIRNISGKNDGTYRCVARNELGEDWKEITLNVQSKFSCTLDVLVVFPCRTWVCLIFGSSGCIIKSS